MTGVRFELTTIRLEIEYSIQLSYPVYRGINPQLLQHPLIDDVATCILLRIKIFQKDTP